MYAHPCASDAALLDDLAMSGTFPDIAWRPQPLATSSSLSSGKTVATRATRATTKKQQQQQKKQKKRLTNANTLSFPLHAPSGTIRQALFPTGPGSYPSPTMALQHNAQAPVERRQRVRIDVSDSTDSDALLDHKRRETGWNTSFPAEYAKSSPVHDFQQTLAYHEQLHRLHDQQQQQSDTRAPPTISSNSSAESDYGSPTQSIERLVLLKEVSMREGLLAKLTALVQSAAHDQDFGTERGNELLHLLLQLRDASVQVMQAIANWHRSLRSGPRAFVVDAQHYALKMVSDLNFLAKTKALGQILGVSPARMKQNPFMMPAPMPERDFHAVQALPWAKTERTFSSDPVERVADAEKYLVWCLFHLGDAAPSPSHGQAGATSPSHRPQPLLANYADTGAPTWQKRAEKQLQVLSMPLEAPTGQTHIMDSSRMMKRKGYLPSLPLSPAKTLTDLIDTVHTSSSSTQHTVPRRLPAVMHLHADWNGVAYTTSSRDLEALGALESPPHHMVTLVAASILILLSPSDRIPKDLSWPSCRKMLASGAKLVDCMDRLQVASVLPFKLKALVPFLQNEHFQPKFLSEFSRAAGALCAWVFASLAAAQNQEVATSRSAEDRLDILGELELEDALGDDSSATRAALEGDAPAKRKSTKRVTIGNAEVLFINENQPMSCSPTPRPASRGETPLARKKSSVLLRTSPWTFRGVTYFVSFFLEATETALSIKLYEPMSSVESQIFVTEEDLEADFGAHASDLFQACDYRPLCDLILHRLDGMMTGERLSARRQEQATGESRWDPQAPDTPERADESEKTSEALESAAAAIDLLELESDDEHIGDQDERQHASDDDDNDGRTGNDDVDELVLRIQCAARQRLARDRVHHVRSEQASKRELLRSVSAVKIQSLARQTLAKKEVARMRLANRVPTGLPTDEVMARGAKQALDGVRDHRVVEEEEEEEAQPPPVGHFRSVDDVSSARPEEDGDDAAQRPETVMSYGSEQFEDDFEQDEDA